MRLWKVVISEVRHVDVEYIVEAEDAEEAFDKAVSGNSERETELKDFGVMERHCHEDPVLYEGEL